MFYWRRTEKVHCKSRYRCGYRRSSKSRHSFGRAFTIRVLYLFGSSLFIYIRRQIAPKRKCHQQRFGINYKVYQYFGLCSVFTFENSFPWKTPILTNGLGTNGTFIWNFRTEKFNNTRIRLFCQSLTCQLLSITIIRSPWIIASFCHTSMLSGKHQSIRAIIQFLLIIYAFPIAIAICCIAHNTSLRLAWILLCGFLSPATCQLERIRIHLLKKNCCLHSVSISFLSVSIIFINHHRRNRSNNH